MFRGVELRVSGLVQGVNLRTAVREYAMHHNLRGMAKNELDGTVRIVAEGQGEALEELIGWLRSNPGASRIERIEVRWQDAANAFTTFTIQT